MIESVQNSIDITNCAPATTVSQLDHSNIDSDESGHEAIASWTIESNCQNVKFIDNRSGQTWQLPTSKNWLEQYPYNQDLSSSLGALVTLLQTKKSEPYCALSVSTYMQRLNARQYKHALKEDILFGLVLGWTLALVGSFHYFILLERKVWLWSSLVGLTFLCASTIIPQSLRPIRKAMKILATSCAGWVLKVILIAIYYLTITPVGYWLQKQKGTHPFYSWEEISPDSVEGWMEKQVAPLAQSVPSISRKRIASWWQPVKVLGYFITHSQLVLLPCLIFFLVLGLIGIFVQSTALAPMIYSLF